MSKHTPGKWELFKRQRLSGKWIVGVNEGETDIAEVETKEDARLIAAAPDLLNACREAVVAISFEYCFHPRECSGDNAKCYANHLLAAIAKAEGK